MRARQVPASGMQQRVGRERGGRHERERSPVCESQWRVPQPAATLPPRPVARPRPHGSRLGKPRAPGAYSGLFPGSQAAAAVGERPLQLPGSRDALSAALQSRR